MNTFQLTCFVAVAETLNFARAAEKLHVTQPAVTQQIHSLEKELNVKLFKRTTRMVKITAEGSVFFNDAKQMLEIGERAKKRFENQDYKVKIQTLSLGCHTYTQLFRLTLALKQLREEFPDLHPQLRVIPFQHLYRMLEEEDIDGIIGFKDFAAAKSSAVYKELKKVPLVCVCETGHPLAGRKSISIEDLGTERLILCDPAMAHGEISKLQGQLIGGRSIAELHFCNAMESALVLAEAGFGVAVLPSMFIPPNPVFTSVLLEDVEPISFGIYYKSLEENPALKSLVKIMEGLEF